MKVNIKIFWLNRTWKEFKFGDIPHGNSFSKTRLWSTAVYPSLIFWRPWRRIFDVFFTLFSFFPCRKLASKIKFSRGSRSRTNDFRKLHIWKYQEMIVVHLLQDGPTTPPSPPGLIRIFLCDVNGRYKKVVSYINRQSLGILIWDEGNDNDNLTSCYQIHDRRVLVGGKISRGNFSAVKNRNFGNYPLPPTAVQRVTFFHELTGSGPVRSMQTSKIDSDLAIDQAKYQDVRNRGVSTRCAEWVEERLFRLGLFCAKRSETLQGVLSSESRARANSPISWSISR